MGAKSKIEWTDHTFNPWVGCTQISAACDHCYAQTWAKGAGWPELWQGERRRTRSANWRGPHLWNQAAFAMGERHRVFCASLADVFDNQIPEDWRTDLWALIEATPNLDWLLLTKRPQNIVNRMPMGTVLQKHPWPWHNVWLGTTVENQREAERRLPLLLDVPAKVHFVSCEPLLGPLDIKPYLWEMHAPIAGYDEGYGRRKPGIDWVICGGESGPNARPMHPDWARSLRDQCASAGVPFFFKQWGGWFPYKPAAGGDLGGDVRSGRVSIVHPSGRTNVEIFNATCGRSTEHGSLYMTRICKKNAGRLLDGRTHDQFPKFEKVMT